MVQEKKSKRLSRKLQKSYVIKTDIDELSDVLCELLKLLKIEELHIMTYKDRIDVFATKEMTPLHVELYERFFSLHPDDAEKEELLKEQIYHDWLLKKNCEYIVNENRIMLPWWAYGGFLWQNL